MIDINDDVISYIGEYLSHKDIFFAATMDKQWYNALFFHKKVMLKEIQKETTMAHYCDNLCPCILEKFYQTMITEFKLKRHICSQLNDTETRPEWLRKYLDDD